MVPLWYIAALVVLIFVCHPNYPPHLSICPILISSSLQSCLRFCSYKMYCLDFPSTTPLRTVPHFMIFFLCFCEHSCVFVCVCVRVCIHTHTHKHTHTHTYIYIYIYIDIYILLSMMHVRITTWFFYFGYELLGFKSIVFSNIHFIFLELL